MSIPAIQYFKQDKIHQRSPILLNSVVFYDFLFKRHLSIIWYIQRIENALRSIVQKSFFFAVNESNNKNNINFALH